MNRFSDLDLPWYIKDDLRDLEKKYPGIFDKTPEELDKIASNFYWEAENAYAEANRIESQGDYLRAYLKAIGYKK